MEILLWLVPAALVTVLAAWGAGLAARRDERQRQEREQTQVSTSRPDVVEEGVSEARPSRRPAEPEAGDERERGGEHGPVRRSA